MLSIIEKLTRLPVFLHGVLAAAVFAALGWVQGWLDASYAASGHPVDYATGQTTFSAETIKGYYAHMNEAGTLDVYLRTQIIDFGFIAAMALSGLFIGTFIARLGRQASLGRRLGLWAALAVIGGAVCDAIENGVSFIMLADPQGFADWLALPYSGFASVKFALIALGLLLALASLVISLAGRGLGRAGLG